MNLTTQVRSTIISNLFSLIDVTKISPEKIGLYYHVKRQLLFAVGRELNSNIYNSLVCD